MANDSILQPDQLKQRLAQQIRARVPFNPLDSLDIAGANVTRLQKSMESFGWGDPRFVTRVQAEALGWKIPPKAESVELRYRDSEDGSATKIAVFNAKNVKGMPPLDAMMAMSEADLAWMRRVAAGDAELDDEVSIGPAPQLTQKVAVGGPDAGAGGAPVNLQPGFHRLIGRGAAPFQDDPKNALSYFAELQDVKGIAHKVWGVDLDRSLDAAQVQIGDAVSLVKNGHRVVEIDERQKDGSYVRKPVERINWDTVLQGKELVQPTQESSKTPELPGSGAAAAISGAAAEQEVKRYAVLAPYWRNGLHNFEGVALAEEINAAIRKGKLTEDKEAITKLMSVYPKARQLGMDIVPESQYLGDPHLKANRAQPTKLLNGALVRDSDGMYRPAAGGRPVLQDKSDSIVLKNKESDAYRGAMELAIAKGWTAIELKGKPAMLANAWLEAKLMGLDVVNYSPNEKDLANYHSRVTEEGKRKAAEVGRPAQQAPEMVEVRPFIDANGQQKMATVTYTVSAPAMNDALFDTPRDAARAYASLSPAGTAVVVRTVTRADGMVRDEVVAGVGRGPTIATVADSMEGVVDREFNEALAEAVAEEEAAASLKSPPVVTTGTHIGPVVAIEEGRFAQKTGRDPSKVVWHDLASLKGVVPKLGEMAEIKYAKGLATVKAKALQKELDGVER